MRAITAFGSASGSQPRTKKLIPSLLVKAASNVFMLFSGCDLELACTFTACFARCFFHVISLPGCPEQTLTDQPKRHKTNWIRVPITVRGGRCMVNEKQVKVQSMNRDITGLRTKETAQKLQCGFPPRVQRKSLDQYRLGFAPQCGVIQEMVPQALSHTQ